MAQAVPGLVLRPLSIDRVVQGQVGAARAGPAGLVDLEWVAPD